jgi:hypothetical protein
MNRIAKIVAFNVILWGFVFLSVVFLWCLTQLGGSAHIGPILICVGMLSAILLAVIVIVPFWVILERLGVHPAFSILMLIPLANLITLYFVAFSKSNSRPSPISG